MDAVCTISTPGEAERGEQGGVIIGPPTVQTNVPCQLVPLGSNHPAEKAIADRLSLANPAIIYLEHDRDVHETSTITTEDGDVFNVRGVLPEMARSRASRRVVVDQVR
jgi:hypothetical protein